MLKTSSVLEGLGPLSCWKEHWLYKNVYNRISFRFRKQNLSYWISSGLKNICQNLTEECVMCTPPASPSFPVCYLHTSLCPERRSWILETRWWNPSEISQSQEQQCVFLQLCSINQIQEYTKQQIKPHNFLASLATDFCEKYFSQQSSLPESCFSSYRCVFLVLSLLQLR